jgi:hydroxyethylthiazole kinase-like uncharacterized protein yjeF
MSEVLREIGIVGVGSMGSAIARGLIEAGYIRPSQLAVCDKNREQIEAIGMDWPDVGCYEQVRELCDNCRYVVFAVKPNVLADTIADCGTCLTDHPVISIAAGWTVAMLQGQLEPLGARWLRVMPNTPALVGEGMTAICSETTFSEAVDTEDFNAVGIGPGLGTSEQTAIAIITQLRRTQCPIVCDADAINILANHHAWVQQLPKGIIMTPHPKEFDRLEGHSSDSYERLSKVRDLTQRLGAYVILKGHCSALCCPDGHIVFNSTGNAGMATAGSGDVLTGILTGLLARGYGHREACIVGMYLHGMAGDIAAREVGEESLIARDIIRCLPKAFMKLRD